MKGFLLRYHTPKRDIQSGHSNNICYDHVPYQYIRVVLQQLVGKGHRFIVNFILYLN